VLISAYVRASGLGLGGIALAQTLYEPCRQRVRFPSFRACTASAASWSLGDEERVTRQTRQTSGSRGVITSRHLTVAGPHAASKAIRSVHPENRNSRWRASVAPAPAPHCSGSARAARRAPSSRPGVWARTAGPRHKNKAPQDHDFFTKFDEKDSFRPESTCGKVFTLGFF
jgi:hypothetical protein